MGRRIMALDVGEKRVGVAVSDETGTLAVPKPPLIRRGLAQDIDRIRDMAEGFSVERIVVGWPVGLSGQEGPQALAVRRFAEALARRLPWPVELVDERLSTQEAERVLIAGDVDRRRRRTLVDGLAAAVILRRYLDRQQADQKRSDRMSEKDRIQGLNADDDEIITLTDEDGEDHDFVVVDVIEVSDQEYAILLPYEAADEEEAEAVILRVEKSDDGDDQLVEIEDEAEWQAVVDAYEAVLESEDEDED
jgi:putative Holliday junction resolvase